MVMTANTEDRISSAIKRLTNLILSGHEFAVNENGINVEGTPCAVVVYNRPPHGRVGTTPILAISRKTYLENRDRIDQAIRHAVILRDHGWIVPAMMGTILTYRGTDEETDASLYGLTHKIPDGVWKRVSGLFYRHYRYGWVTHHPNRTLEALAVEADKVLKTLNDEARQIIEQKIEYARKHAEIMKRRRALLGRAKEIERGIKSVMKRYDPPADVLLLVDLKLPSRVDNALVYARIRDDTWLAMRYNLGNYDIWEHSNATFTWVEITQDNTADAVFVKGANNQNSTGMSHIAFSIPKEKCGDLEELIQIHQELEKLDKEAQELESNENL